MSNQSATYIIIDPLESHTPLDQRFKRTFQVARDDNLYILPHPEQPALPNGTSAEAIMYALGHREQRLEALTRLSPAMMRQLRELIHIARRTGGTIHLFGIVDNSSPYGSRRALEAVLRFLRPANVAVAIHVGIWHPTPREFRQGMQEIESLCHQPIALGSVYPVQTVLEHQGAKHYIDGLLHPDAWHNPSEVTLPLTVPCLFLEEAEGPNDSFVMVNHALHGQDALAEEIEEATHQVCHILATEHDSSGDVARALDKSKHIMAVTSKPAYQEAYFGSATHHPYFESYSLPSSTHILEMLISPHFGYHQPPFRTIVSVKEEHTPDFDWLLSSLLRHKQADPYYCCFLAPQSVEGNLVMTNIPITDDSSLYQQLNCYV